MHQSLQVVAHIQRFEIMCSYHRHGLHDARGPELDNAELFPSSRQGYASTVVYACAGQNTKSRSYFDVGTKVRNSS